MKVNVEEIEACKRRLAVEAPVDVVQAAWDRAYGRVQKAARLPGFRKGHVPRSLVKLHFADAVRREVAEDLIPDMYRQAVSEARLDPVNEPNLEDVHLEEGGPLTFVAVVEVKPTITLGAYKGVPVQHRPSPIGDADVDRALEQMREGQAQFTSVARPAAPGDLVVVDYTLTPESGEPFSETGYAFIIGEGAVMPEIDAAVVGMVAGAECRVGVRFPQDHRLEDLRGRAGAAVVKVGEVKEKVLPALDDEFAKSLGTLDTVEALRAEVRRQLEARRQSDDRRVLEDKIVEALLASHDFGAPEAMVLRHIAHQIEHGRERMRRQGLDPDRVQWDDEKLVAELRPTATATVRRALLLAAIAEREGLQPRDADVDAEIDRIARATQRPLPAVRRMMEKSGDLDALRGSLQERTTLDFLIDHAVIGE